ncbi:hypothetical protein [Streptomyces lydicus]|uniref:hypothetical protein n=1 Tax=Streptomyces lydicus TaxID=47763 RepID=UPI0036E5584B
MTLADEGGLLGPLTSIKTSDGLPASLYELTGGSDSISDTAMRFLMGGLFALARTVTGFACWVVDWVYRFPIIDTLSSTAQRIADAYAQHIVTPLGLGGIFIAWSFAFGLFMVARGRSARGFGEIVLTLLIAAIAATSIVRPDVMLGYNGPLQQAQRAALEAATITTQATGAAKQEANDPCSLVVGPAQKACEQSGVSKEAKKAAQQKAKKQREKVCDVVVGPAHKACMSGERLPSASNVSQPITHTLSDVLIVQPYQLLQYGRLINKTSPLYKDYTVGLVTGNGDPTAHPCDMLDGKAGDLCRKRSQTVEDRCDAIPGPLKADCQKANGMSADGQGEGQKKLLEQHGADGKAAAAYMSDLTWDRVLGALFVLIAALIMALVVLAMAMAMIAAQFACVIAAVSTYVVFMWALLPGPNRMVLWRWLGAFASSTVVLFGIAVFIPLFGVAAKELLSTDDSSLIERLLLLDGLAVTALLLHRRMVAKGSNLGHAFASRMRFAKIGGTHTMGDEAAGMGMALAAMGVDRRGPSGQGAAASISLARSGNSPAHAALAMRRGKLASGMAALSDSTGLPGNPMGALGEARAEARRAFAPLSVPLRAAQIAWVGPPRASGPRPGTEGSRPDSPAVWGSRRRTPMVIDGSTGEVMSDPNQGVTPAGERLRERISRTRGGRVLLGVGRIAWHSTVGTPAAWTRTRRKGSDLTREMDRQLRHYIEVRERWGRNSRSGLRDASAGARRLGYDRAMDPLRRASRLERWISTGGSSLRSHRTGGSDPRPRPDDGEHRGDGGERP